MRVNVLKQALSVSNWPARHPLLTLSADTLPPQNKESPGAGTPLQPYNGNRREGVSRSLHSSPPSYSFNRSLVSSLSRWRSPFIISADGYSGRASSFAPSTRSLFQLSSSARYVALFVPPSPLLSLYIKGFQEVPAPGQWVVPYD